MRTALPSPTPSSRNPAIAGAIVVMLTSAGQPGDAARCRESGIAAYLSKPIKRSELHDAIVLALGVQSGDSDRPALVTRHSLREARHTGHILLVEDNSVNQLVARRLLEKRGHTVVVANNGREALAILDEALFVGFGCVLMDVQMPDMDGFECTALIRARERTTGCPSPDRRDDRACDDGRSGTLPGGGDGRVSVEAHSTGRALRAR